MKSNEHIIIFSTIDSRETAREIAHSAVSKRLASSCNMIPGVSSLFRWKGEICEKDEIMMVFYTRRSLANPLSELIREKHPYEVPVVVGSDISEGLDSSITWIASNTASSVEDY